MKLFQKKEVKIGVISLISLILFVWLCNFFLGKNFLRPEKYCYAVYDSVEGLAPSDFVIIQGMHVGKIKKMEFIGQINPKILVTFTLKPDVHVPSNSIARIQSSGLLGSKCITIKFGDAKTYVQSGDTLMSEVEKGMFEEINQQIAPIKWKTEKLIGSMDSAITVVTAIFNAQTQQSIQQSFVHIQQSLEHIKNMTNTTDDLLSSEKNKIASIINNLESVSSMLQSNNKQITNIIHNFSQISDTIRQANVAKTFHELNSTLTKTASVMDKIESGEGSLGLLVNDKQLYNELNQASINLSKLLEDIQKNPGRYVSVSVFGKKQK